MQFDVHRNTGKQRVHIPYVVIVQSSYFEKAHRRVVIPLVACTEISKVARLPASTLNPQFEIEGTAVILNPLEIVSVHLDALGEKVASLAEHGDTIIAALDELFTRVWR